jgi:beta-lactamase superfamily II metal-dependent hydrolase
MTKKTKVQKSRVKLRAYNLIERAVEEGVRWGWQHAHKHTANPTQSAAEDQIVNDVMQQLSEIMEYDP